MSALEDIRPFIHLLLRSPDRGEGWRSVSDVLAPMVAERCAVAPELFEQDHGDDGFMVRLSQHGLVVARLI